MTYFIIGIIMTIILFIMYNKMKQNNLIDKERELMLQLKEQEKETLKLEQEYEKRKKNFFDMVGEFERAKQQRGDGRGNDHSKL